MQDLIVHAIQEDLIWENEQANLQLFEQRISEIGESDLILLPEMFNTGFTMNPGANANPEPGPVLDWMMDQAHKADSAICGSTIVRVNEEYFNRLYWCRPDGSHEFYDKRHLFSLAGEEKVYSAGNSIIQTEIKGWKIRPLICYDLRFPVWCRNDSQYDLLLFVANWPKRRIAHWDKLLIARAIENQAYVIGLNRVGNDGNDVYHNGSSQIISPQGEVMEQVCDEARIISGRLQYEEITTYRNYLAALQDGDSFTLDF